MRSKPNPKPNPATLGERMLGRYDSSPDSYGFDLRLDLAELIVRGLKAKQWSVGRLSEESGVAMRTITGYVNSSANFDIGTAGMVLFALGIKPRIQGTLKAGHGPGKDEALKNIQDIPTPMLKAMRDLCPSGKGYVSIEVDGQTVTLTKEARDNAEAELKRRKSQRRG